MVVYVESPWDHRRAGALGILRQEGKRGEKMEGREENCWELRAHREPIIFSFDFVPQKRCRFKLLRPLWVGWRRRVAIWADPLEITKSAT